MKNSKVWMWQGDPLAETFFNELEKSPIALPITDVLLSLQTGMLNAVYCSPMAALALQWFTRVEYISDIPFTHATGAVLMDKKAFEKIDPAGQNTIIQVCKSNLITLVKRSRADNVEAYEYLSKEGLTEVSSDSEQRLEMRQIGERVNKKLVDKLYSSSLLNRIDSLLTEYRENRK